MLCYIEHMILPESGQECKAINKRSLTHSLTGVFVQLSYKDSWIFPCYCFFVQPSSNELLTAQILKADADWSLFNQQSAPQTALPRLSR